MDFFWDILLVVFLLATLWVMSINLFPSEEYYMYQNFPEGWKKYKKERYGGELTPFNWIMIFLPGMIKTIIWFCIMFGIWLVIQWVRSLISPDVYWNPFE